MVSAQFFYKIDKPYAAYCRNDLLRHFRYLVLHNGVLLRSFIGMLTNRGFSDCCPVPPRFAAKCLAEKVIDKQLEEK